jgi:2-iminobutanoate/2-iminopropanoate deaminase
MYNAFNLIVILPQIRLEFRITLLIFQFNNYYKENIKYGKLLLEVKLMKIINSNNAPKAIGPYSQAILSGNTLYVSGQLPINPVTNEIPLDIASQTRQCLKNIESILIEASMNLTNVVKCTVLLIDMNHFNQMNEIYANFFGNHKPARMAYQVSRLPKDVLVEIDCIAVKY